MDPKILVLLGFSFIIFNGMEPLSKKGMEIANILWTLFFLMTLAIIIESIVLRIIVALILGYGVLIYFIKKKIYLILVKTNYSIFYLLKKKKFHIFLLFYSNYNF